ncbi:type II toxin-antitoxin system VapC family toxin [Sphingomonas sp. PB4P5]|uniref:type II toxin-antitoxin system VapC family toxin n=1 Tax=Parasphingomonas puruogangriensis TaxID=3096155 RepID=UPI002FC72747
MRLLLDTHVLLWWLEGSPKLGARARGYFSDQSTEILYSVASPWEMAIKISQGKLAVDIGDAIRSFDGAGFKRIDIETAHLVTLSALERLHGDPFDRMIVVQAMCGGLVVMTTDSAVLRYPVQTIGCR